MIAKEFKSANSSKYLFLTTFIILGLIALLLAPLFFANFKYNNILKMGTILIPLLWGPLTSIRKLSVNRKYLYLHFLIGWKKYKLAKLVSIQKKPGLIDNKFNFKKLFKKYQNFSGFGKKKDLEIGEYTSYVTESQKVVLLVFEDKKIALSPDHPERFMGFVRNYLNYNRLDKKMKMKP